MFVGNFDCPFRAMDNLLESVGDSYKVILVDFHAEATSEKMALGWYLDGRVSAVAGHAHPRGHRGQPGLHQGDGVRLRPGMVGPRNSVIGSAVEDVLVRFLNQTPRRLAVAGGPLQFNSVLVEIDEDSGSATAITRVDRWVD